MRKPYLCFSRYKTIVIYLDFTGKVTLKCSFKSNKMLLKSPLSIRSYFLRKKGGKKEKKSLPLAQNYDGTNSLNQSENPTKDLGCVSTPYNVHINSNGHRQCNV